MYDSEELAELVAALFEGRFDDYRIARRRFFPFVSAREVLSFLDDYADRTARKEKYMADGLDWGAARGVLADLLWDFECGRKPHLAKHLKRRTQSPSDIAWGTFASMGAASFLPVFSTYTYLKDTSALALIFLIATIIGPLSVWICRSALNYQWNPALRAVLWGQLAANLLIAAIPYGLFALAVLTAFVPFLW